MKPCKLGCLPILAYSLPSIHPSILPLSMCHRLNLAFTYIDLCISPSIFLEEIHLENEGSSQQHGVSRGGCLPAPVHWLVAILSDLPLDIATPDRSAHVPWKCIKSGAKKGILRTYDLKTFFFFAISCLSFRNPQAPFQKSAGTVSEIHTETNIPATLRWFHPASENSFLARKEPSRSRGTSSTPAMAPTVQNRPIESYGEDIDTIWFDVEPSLEDENQLKHQPYSMTTPSKDWENSYRHLLDHFGLSPDLPFLVYFAMISPINRSTALETATTDPCSLYDLRPGGLDELDTLE